MSPSYFKAWPVAFRACVGRDETRLNWPAYGAYGFAVHREIPWEGDDRPKFWVVSHIPTGLRMGPYAHTRADAIRLAQWLSGRLPRLAETPDPKGSDYPEAVVEALYDFGRRLRADGRAA